MFNHSDTACLKCGYAEPAGSAYFVTFITEVLSQFVSNLGVEKIWLSEVKTDHFIEALGGEGALPALLVNAKLNTKSMGKDFNDLPLKTVPHKAGLYGCRVVTTSNQIINPSLCITALSETIYSAYEKSMGIEENKRNNILDLNLLSPISAMQSSSIKHFTKTIVQDNTQNINHSINV